MTWGDWVNSKYNTIGMKFDSSGYVYKENIQLEQCVKSSNEINSNIIYSYVQNDYIGCRENLT